MIIEMRGEKRERGPRSTRRKRRLEERQSHVASQCAEAEKPRAASDVSCARVRKYIRVRGANESVEKGTQRGRTEGKRKTEFERAPARASRVRTSRSIPPLNGDPTLFLFFSLAPLQPSRATSFTSLFMTHRSILSLFLSHSLFSSPHLLSYTPFPFPFFVKCTHHTTPRHAHTQYMHPRARAHTRQRSSIIPPCASKKLTRSS